MKNTTVKTVFDEAVNLEGKIFVSFTDRFLSGWGEAVGKVHKQVIICDNWAEADKIESSLNSDRSASWVRVYREMPYFAPGKYSVSYRMASDCPAWLK